MGLIRYVVGVLLVVSMPPAILWWIVVHPFVAFWRRLGARPAVGVVSALMAALALGLVPVRDALLGQDLGTSWPMVAVAAVLMAGAGLLAARRKRHLKFRILAGMPELEGDAGTLLTEGPYAVIRHPRYVEVAAAALAYACFANYAGAYVVAALTLPLLHLIVVLEERELARRFGTAWEEYRSRVPRYFPRWG